MFIGAAVGLGIRKRVTTLVVKYRDSEKDRPVVSVERRRRERRGLFFTRASHTTLFRRRARNVRGDMSNVFVRSGLAPVKINWYVSRHAESFLENAPDAPRGFSAGDGHCLRGFSFYPTDMSNAGCITIYVPSQNSPSASTGPLPRFLSLLSSLIRGGASAAPVDEGAFPIARARARALKRDARKSAAPEAHPLIITVILDNER